MWVPQDPVVSYQFSTLASAPLNWASWCREHQPLTTEIVERTSKNQDNTGQNFHISAEHQLINLISGFTPRWKIWVRQLGWWHFQYMEKVRNSCSKPATRNAKNKSPNNGIDLTCLVIPVRTSRQKRSAHALWACGRLSKLDDWHPWSVGEPPNSHGWSVGHRCS